MTNRPLTKLQNIGKTVAAKLNAIGINDERDLKKAGAAKAYRWMSEYNKKGHLPVCYYLYSLQGAIQDRHWDDLSEAEKTKLRRDAGLSH